MRSSAALSIIPWTIPPLVSFSDYISKYLFAASPLYPLSSNNQPGQPAGTRSLRSLFVLPQLQRVLSFSLPIFHFICVLDFLFCNIYVFAVCSYACGYPRFSFMSKGLQGGDGYLGAIRVSLRKDGRDVIKFSSVQCRLYVCFFFPI